MNNPLLSVSVSASPAESASVFLQRRAARPDASRTSDLPCKYFYDERGCDSCSSRICDLEEYYPTRCELAILERHAAEMADWMRRRRALVEYGSGSSRKTRLLLDRAAASRPSTCPVDINGEQLRQTAREPGPALPAVWKCVRSRRISRAVRPAGRSPRVRPVGWSTSPARPSAISSRPRPRELLRHIAGRAVGAAGCLSASICKKDRARLQPAYNDRHGVTAAFNLNLLARINRELGADFALDALPPLCLLQPPGWPHRDAPRQPDLADGSPRADTFAFTLATARASAPSIRTSTTWRISLMAHEAGCGFAAPGSTTKDFSASSTSASRMSEVLTGGMRSGEKGAARARDRRRYWAAIPTRPAITDCRRWAGRRRVGDASFEQPSRPAGSSRGIGSSQDSSKLSGTNPAGGATARVAGGWPRRGRGPNCRPRHLVAIVANGQFIAGGQPAFEEADAVDADAVGAAEIADDEIIADLCDAAMTAGYLARVESECRIRDVGQAARSACPAKCWDRGRGPRVCAGMGSRATQKSKTEGNDRLLH